jgi:hypothetical protein
MVSGLPLRMQTSSLSIFARLGNLARLEQYYYLNIDKIDENEYIQAVYAAIDTRRVAVLQFMIDQRYKLFIYAKVWMDHEYNIIREAYMRGVIHTLDSHVLMIPRDRSQLQPYHSNWYQLIGECGKDLLIFFLDQGLFVDETRLNIVMVSAACRGDISLIAELIRLGAKPGSCFSNALVTAGVYGEWLTVRYLAAHGANLHAQGNTLLQVTQDAEYDSPDDVELKRVLALFRADA